ncbi:lytic transglycosylase [Amylibacter marinus]|uniref:Lytic transglycosylase n=1 Tax=Amylibacter marinus TaxID=1475483 RepID=A0ABQ5VX00_9RHOB|nr:lytic transglycosylase domain-containing protein [Amylibacter marinus]GLQ35729.1 lytic transglycosylase [Amylibacter marinus]
MKKILRAALCLSVLAVGGPVMANLAQDGKRLSVALQAIDAKNWAEADQLRRGLQDKVARDMVVWARLRAGQGAFEDYVEFLARNADWPGLKRLRRSGEASIGSGANARSVVEYFAAQAPQTGAGALALARAYGQLGQDKAARAAVIAGYVNLSLTERVEREFMDRHKRIVSRHYQERMDNLLWKGWQGEASRMIPLVSDAQGKLARARIGLQRQEPNVDALIGAVPRSLAGDGGLAYDRFQWRMKKDRWDEAQELIIEQTSKKLGRAESWGSRRRGFARRAMRAKDYTAAYGLASKHGLSAGADYADLEWLSGYIALKFLNKPKLARKHFERFEGVVKTPVSRGRAGYWLGQVYEALGQDGLAQAAYRDGAQHSTSFYGQLSAERLQLPPDASLMGDVPKGRWQKSSFAKSEVLRAAHLLHHGDRPVMVRWFLAHMAETMGRDDMAMLADFALELNEPFAALGIAKEGAKRGITLPTAYYPVTDLADFSRDVAPEVAMSIARRESELNPDAISHAGARGLMQIMPATARNVAKEIGAEYSKNRLTSDWKYNATLGTAYLAGLLERYDGNYPLAFAGYNAGPHRADDWIAEYGDPRDSLGDPVDWVEHIPFRETRNYVMRVMESLHVYRARIHGAVGVVQLRADLTRG